MRKEIVVPEEVIVSKIYEVRGNKVMLDSDLAELYQVETRRLNEQVKRNVDRFPEDFMFRLTQEEFENLKSQNATSSWGGRRKQPYAFTEYGVLMLSSVLNSQRAIDVNIKIIRIFSKMREMLLTHKDLLIKMDEIERKGLERDDQIMLIFNYIRQFEEAKQEEQEQKNRERIGFKQDE